MEFKGTDHVYKVIPDLFGNKSSYEKYKEDLAAWESDERVLTEEDRAECKPEEVKPAIFHLKGISQEDFSEAIRAETILNQNHTREEAAKKIGENAAKLVSDRVIKIENLVIDGKEITDYEGLAKHAPRELCNYIVACVHSTEILTAEEVKN